MEKACRNTANENFQELLDHFPNLQICRREIQQAFEQIVDTYRNCGKLLICGNGGSAADSEHMVGELMKSFRFMRKIPPEFKKAYVETNSEEVPSWLEEAIPAISLVSQNALSTAFANDRSSTGVFAQQVYGYGFKQDALIAISTSGISANVLAAAKIALAKKMKVIVLTGAVDTELTRIATVAIKAPETETYKIQELHLPIYHCLCAMVEAELFGAEDA